MRCKPRRRTPLRARGPLAAATRRREEAVAELEVYLRSYPMPDEAVEKARAAEADGWDGLLYVDTQNLLYDTFAALYLGADATTRLRLGTAVTNPVTRHPAVL